jgi:ATP adenylyltransferase
LLISPIRHTGDITSLNSDELSEIMLLQVAAVKVLEEIFKPHGFNIGANLGRAAGAGVPGHLHYHVIPRWNGDTNFMPIIAETKILSQSLEDSFQLIADGFRKLIQ